MRTLLVIGLAGATAALALPGVRTSSVTPPVGPPARTAPALAPQSPSPPLRVQEHVLDNGFTILLVEDHRTPRVAANLWVRVGSMQEAVGLHGITHFLEHVIHQGTTTVG
ncbi:MAG: insulinase family protein, partial [Spirochaetaceae bacterium]|nr:insulinase family protein [Spirochaetaceae bacterium]